MSRNNESWFTGMSATTAGPLTDNWRPNVVHKTWVTQAGENPLHGAEWFIKQGRAQADEANAMLAFWGKFLLWGCAIGWLIGFANKFIP